MGKLYEMRIGSGTKNPLDGGLCLNEETSLDISQSPHNGLLNMCLDNGGTLTKRLGQRYIFDEDINNKPIQGMYVFKDKVFFVNNGSCYTLIDEVKENVNGSFSQNKVFFFVYNGVLYALDGENYQFLNENDNTFKSVVPYIPRVTMNRKPDGSNSQVDESWNMLGDKFKDSFNGDGTSTVYKLSLSSLSDGNVEAKVNGVVKTVTVDASKGEITFSEAPPEGLNNVEIIATKVFDGLKDNITKCTTGIEFSSRMFFTGNPNLNNMYFAAGLSEDNSANYFPQKYLYAVGGTDKKVTGFKVHQNRLVVFKEDMTCTVEAALGLDNTASFPIQFLNTEIGCDIPDSIQLIDNNIVFANTYTGVNVIYSTVVPGEKSIISISKNINGDYFRNGLLQEPKLKEATSVDHDFKYYLCCGDSCYVFDYKKGINIKNPANNTWFLYDNIKASCFLVENNELYYGHNEKGNIVKFSQYKNDFGEPIYSVWKSKLIDFGYPDYLKMIQEAYVTFKNNQSTDCEVSVAYYSENGQVDKKIIINNTNAWSWNNFDWNSFDWKVVIFDKTIKDKVRVKKISYFQIELSNNKANQDLAIKNISLNYRIIRRVK